jgi:hypothetical protein
MTFDDFDLALVRQIVERKSSFHTRDVSGDPRMEQRHNVSRMSKNEKDTYLRMTGRFLSMNRAALGLRLEPDSKSGLGRRWMKVVK